MFCTAFGMLYPVPVLDTSVKARLERVAGDKYIYYDDIVNILEYKVLFSILSCVLQSAPLDPIAERLASFNIFRPYFVKYVF